MDTTSLPLCIPSPMILKGNSFSFYFCWKLFVLQVKPLVICSIQSAILVNRGWVPLAWGKQALGREVASSPHYHTINLKLLLLMWSVQEESVELVGVISKGERPNTLWRSNNPAKSEWFTVDVPSLAHACGLPETTLHVVEIDSSSKMNTRKPYPFAFLACQVKEIYLSQLEHARYSALG